MGGCSSLPRPHLPIGYTETGEPLGAYLIGLAEGGADLLVVGYAIEQATQVCQPPDLDKTLATFTNLHHATPSRQ